LNPKKNQKEGENIKDSGDWQKWLIVAAISMMAFGAVLFAYSNIRLGFGLCPISFLLF